MIEKDNEHTRIISSWNLHTQLPPGRHSSTHLEHNCVGVVRAKTRVTLKHADCLQDNELQGSLWFLFIEDYFRQAKIPTGWFHSSQGGSKSPTDLEKLPGAQHIFMTHLTLLKHVSPLSISCFLFGPTPGLKTTRCSVLSPWLTDCTACLWRRGVKEVCGFVLCHILKYPV